MLCLEVGSFKKKSFSGWWQYTPLIPALWSQEQMDLGELKASLSYRANSKIARATQKNSVWGRNS